MPRADSFGAGHPSFCSSVVLAAHEELGEFALSVNPFDIQELADSIHAALTMDRGERERRMAGLERIVTQRDPGDWIDEQLADIRKKAEARA